jgi:hypothetical protein
VAGPVRRAYHLHLAGRLASLRRLRLWHLLARLLPSACCPWRWFPLRLRAVEVAFVVQPVRRILEVLRVDDMRLGEGVLLRRCGDQSRTDASGQCSLVCAECSLPAFLLREGVPERFEPFGAARRRPGRSVYARGAVALLNPAAAARKGGAASPPGLLLHPSACAEGVVGSIGGLPCAGWVDGAR